MKIGELTKKLDSSANQAQKQFEQELSELQSRLSSSLTRALNTIERDIRVQAVRESEKYKTYLSTLSKALVIPALISAILVLTALVATLVTTYQTNQIVELFVQRDLLERELRQLTNQRDLLANPAHGGSQKSPRR